MNFPILAIDYGKRHIGVAVSDSKGIISTPLPVINVTEKTKIKGALSAISAICLEYNIKSLVFGMPQAFEQHHIQTQETILKFIKKVIDTTKLPYTTVDESFSTTAAQNMLLSSGKRTKATRKKIDSVAAALFLQQFLDSLAKQE
jgi:putative Holliday junction resolvase